MYHRGHCPWMVWDPERSGAARSESSAPHITATPADPAAVAS